MNISELLQWVNVLLVPLLYILHNVDKRLTRIEIQNEILSCSNCTNHKPKGQ